MSSASTAYPAWTMGEDAAIAYVLTAYPPRAQRAIIARKLPNRSWPDVVSRFEALCKGGVDYQGAHAQAVLRESLKGSRPKDKRRAFLDSRIGTWIAAKKLRERVKSTHSCEEESRPHPVSHASTLAGRVDKRNCPLVRFAQKQVEKRNCPIMKFVVQNHSR